MASSASPVVLLELPIGGDGWETGRAHLVWDPTVAPALLLQPIYLTPDGRAVPAAAPFAVVGGTATLAVTAVYALRLEARLPAPGPAASVFVSWVRGQSAAVGFTTT